MANKRELKKSIRNMAESLAGETVFIANYYDNIDLEKADDVIGEILDLLTEKTRNISVSFDKTCNESFEGNKKEYRKARRVYYRQCYNELEKEFDEGVKEILKKMNALLSKEQKEENKKMAQA